MTDFGTEAAKVNSQAYTVSITNSATGEYLFLQDCRMVIAHTEFKEPTTSGGNIYYSGTPTNRLIGTVLFTKDTWSQSNIGFSALFARTNGEAVLFTGVVTLTPKTGSATVFTFTNKMKCESVDVTKAAEGATKLAVSFILTDDPVQT